MELIPIVKNQLQCSTLAITTEVRPHLMELQPYPSLDQAAASAAGSTNDMRNNRQFSNQLIGHNL